MLIPSFDCVDKDGIGDLSFLEGKLHEITLPDRPRDAAAMTPDKHAMPRHEWSESHAPETTAMLLQLHRAQGLALSRARLVWARHELSPAEFDVLASLRNAPAPHELTPSQLHESLLITSGGLSKVMGQLESRQLVLRSRQTLDQRIKPVRLTVLGRHLVEKAMAELAAESRAWVQRMLSAAEISRLTALLAKITVGERSGGT